MKRLFILIFALVMVGTGCGRQRNIHSPLGLLDIRPELESEINKSEGVLQYLSSDIEALEGNLNKSLEDINKAIAEHPNVGFLYYQRAELYAAFQKFEPAMSDVKTALELEPDAYPAQLLLAKIHASLDHHDTAIIKMEALLKTHPQDEALYSILAREYMLTKEYNRAAAVLQSLIDINPESVNAYFYLATIYSTYLNDLPKAEDMYKKLIELQPENVFVYSAMAQLYMENKRPKEALPYLLEVERRSPGDLSVQLRLASIYYEAGDVQEALARLDRIISLNPSADKVRYFAGVMNESLRHPDVAFDHYRVITDSSSYYVNARVRMAVIRRDQQRIDDAISALNEAIGHQPKESLLYEIGAAILEGDGRSNEMALLLERAVAVVPSEKLYLSLAVAYDRLDQREKAIASMRHVLSFNGDNVTALNYIGYTFVEENRNLDEAEAFLTRALALSPKDGYVMDSMAWLYFQRGDYPRCMTMLNRAIKLSPNEPTIWHHIGDVQLKLGLRRQAIGAYEKALKLAQEKAKPNEKEIESIKAALDIARGPSLSTP